VIAAAIVGCEVTFWVLLVGGLTARYRLGRSRLGALLLMGVPLVDGVLLAAAAVDLASGTRADSTHGLAAVYVGFSIAFGPILVRGADRRFAYRFGVHARQAPRETATEDRLAAHWHLWARCLFACTVACVALAALVLVGGKSAQTQALWAGGGWFLQLGVVCTVWLLLGPVWTWASRRLRPSASR
jgi:hypothetical protein